MTTRRGYWIALALALAAGGFLVVSVWRLYATVAAMPRIDARGEHIVDLPAGDLIVFGEVHEATPNGSVRCIATDAAGAPLTLSAPGAQTSYDLGGYHGRSVFEIAVRAAGPVKLACETESDVKLAIGSGIGARIAVAVVVTMVGGIAASIVFFVTFMRRRKQKGLLRDGQLVGGPIQP